tara:strand:- start:5156 stop:6097 length:942 start_codon:yes stop_codon:yes gene_type:complete
MSVSKIKKVLVIGGYGFIGSHISTYYESEGADVYKTSRYLKSSVDLSKNGFYSDYSKESFSKILLSHEFDLIFYLSGNPYPAFSEKDPSYDIEHTITPTINLLNALVETHFKGALWYASSVAVYGKTELPFQGEDDLCQPLSSYGLAKLNAEEYIKLYARNHRISAGSFRVFSTFGEGLKRQIIYDLFLKCNQDSDVLELYGSGKEKRDICYVGDQVLRMASIAEAVKPEGDVFNIGSGVSYSTEYIAETILKILDSPKKIKYIEPIRKFDGYQWTASTKKFSSILPNIKPNFEDSLKKTLQSYKMEIKKNEF